MPIRLSTRLSIRWPPAPASEPTDTVVLSVGEYFVDLRVRLADGSIDWAIAGTREILSPDPLRIRFNHTIDSRAVNAPPDEGTFSQLPNGDDLEIGSMPCPEQGGAVMPYEEVWRTIPAPPGPALKSSSKDKAWILQSQDGKTFVGKAGGLFISLRRTEKGFGARREEWVSAEIQWKPKYVIGENDVGKLPSLVDDLVEGEGMWEVGQLVEIFGEKWRVMSLANVS